ncbi:DUF58 domain-containing protein [Halosquirtibacter laminarini]|uniref:DUF58 domain-containing protein n=1 Tax=Halosquirtibacter laminarini TaxID=3374600 RepID=A0AC61NEE3_9BACT|nr:DUF58 domain-containing protein [Prolixibacteraceae bacterium]
MKENKKNATEDYRIVTNIQRLKKLQHDVAQVGYSPDKVVQTILTGGYRSKLRGRGMEFEEVRNYVRGDDIRNIDWKVTGRTDALHSKVFTEERERPVFIITDQSRSMDFGTDEFLKSVIASEASAIITWKILAVGDRVGGIIYNDTEHNYFTPRKSKSHALSMVSELAKYNKMLRCKEPTKKRQSHFDQILFEVKKRVTHDYLIIWISDFNELKETDHKGIVELNEHNDVILIRVKDKMEEHLDLSNITYTDGERQLRFTDVMEKQKEKAYNYFKEKRQNFKRLSQHYPITTLELNTSIDTTHQFKEILRKSR